MANFKILILQLLMFAVFVPFTLRAGWTSVTLPRSHSYPVKEGKKADFSFDSYSLKMPTTPVKWYKAPECYNEKLNRVSERATSAHFASDSIQNISGLSFKGLASKEKLGSRKNAFAIFFHENACYQGGGEYGWLFPDSRKEGAFYLCANCNLGSGQKWCTWPNIGEGTCSAKGEGCAKMQKLLENPATYRYWNIKLSPQGNFNLQLVDPSSWKTESCDIEKPSWFPNLYDKPGFITANAQKRAEVNVTPSPIFHVDEVKIWRP